MGNPLRSTGTVQGRKRTLQCSHKVRGEPSSWTMGEFTTIKVQEETRRAGGNDRRRPGEKVGRNWILVENELRSSTNRKLDANNLKIENQAFFTTIRLSGRGKVHRQSRRHNEGMADETKEKCLMYSHPSATCRFASFQQDRNDRKLVSNSRETIMVRGRWVGATSRVRPSQSESSAGSAV